MNFKNWVLIALAFLLAACNLPAVPANTNVTVESKITSAWEKCVSNTGVFTHVCTHTSLSSLAEATPIEPGFAVPAGTLVLVNERDAFVVNGNQPGTKGTDYVLIAGAQTGLSSTYLTLQNVTMRVAGKQIALQNANPSSLFPGWGTWPPVLPTAFVIQTPGPVDATATPTVIPAPFTTKDFFDIWYSQTSESNLVNLLDAAFDKWGKYYGREVVATTFTFVPAGSIIWAVETSNVVDLSQQPFGEYNDCITTFNEDRTVIYTVCDVYVTIYPMKYLSLKDWQEFQLGMLPKVPFGVNP